MQRVRVGVRVQVWERERVHASRAFAIDSSIFGLSFECIAFTLLELMSSFLNATEKGHWTSVLLCDSILLSFIQIPPTKSHPNSSRFRISALSTHFHQKTIFVYLLYLSSLPFFLSFSLALFRRLEEAIITRNQKCMWNESIHDSIYFRFSASRKIERIFQIDRLNREGIKQQTKTIRKSRGTKQKKYCVGVFGLFSPFTSSDCATLTFYFYFAEWEKNREFNQ